MFPRFSWCFRFFIFNNQKPLQKWPRQGWSIFDLCPKKCYLHHGSPFLLLNHFWCFYGQRCLSVYRPIWCRILQAPERGPVYELSVILRCFRIRCFDILPLVYFVFISLSPKRSAQGNLSSKRIIPIEPPEMNKMSSFSIVTAAISGNFS